MSGLYYNLALRNSDLRDKDSEKLYYCGGEVTKIVYFIGNEHMLIAHDSNRLRFS